MVLCLEMLEHTEDWRSAVAQIKEIAKPGGKIVLTTRRWGFPYHGYPHDYWRYEVTDLLDIFSDCQVQQAGEGPLKGAFICAVKPTNFVPINLNVLEMRPIGNYRRPGMWSLQ
jgi:SAM-dependent methyltransferase